MKNEKHETAEGTDGQFISPKMILWAWQNGLYESAGEAIRHYIYWSIVMSEKNKKSFFKSEKTIAETFGVSSKTINSAVSRSKHFKRAGNHGDRGRHWVLSNSVTADAKQELSPHGEDLISPHGEDSKASPWGIQAPTVKTLSPHGEDSHNIEVIHKEEIREKKQIEGETTSSFMKKEREENEPNQINERNPDMNPDANLNSPKSQSPRVHGIIYNCLSKSLGKIVKINLDTLDSPAVGNAIVTACQLAGIPFTAMFLEIALKEFQKKYDGNPDNSVDRLIINALARGNASKVRGALSSSLLYAQALQDILEAKKLINPAGLKIRKWQDWAELLKDVIGKATKEKQIEEQEVKPYHLSMSESFLEDIEIDNPEEAIG